MQAALGSTAVGESSRADCNLRWHRSHAVPREDWHDEYRRSNPHAPTWVSQRPPGHEAELRSLTIPTLLIWATRDPISPPAVGRHLAGLLPNAKLFELDDHSHVFARERPDDVAPLISAHLAQP